MRDQRRVVACDISRVLAPDAARVAVRREHAIGAQDVQQWQVTLQVNLDDFVELLEHLFDSFRDVRNDLFNLRIDELLNVDACDFLNQFVWILNSVFDRL